MVIVHQLRIDSMVAGGHVHKGLGTGCRWSPGAAGSRDGRLTLCIRRCYVEIVMNVALTTDIGFPEFVCQHEVGDLNGDLDSARHYIGTFHW